MQKCHAPYSKFPVGAALRTRDGRIYSGCNIEVISFPEGWCAETTALSHFVMGGGGEISEILVVAEKLEKCPPCGGCRQRLAEFAGPETPLHLCNNDGVVETVRLGDLLPHGFKTDVIGG
jgi:cytidine deaminase